MYGLEPHKNRETGHKISAKLLLSSILALAGADALADGLFGEEPALGSPESRLTQAEIENGHLSLNDLRFAGLKVFATQFNQYDGYGDGPVDTLDKTSPGGRPTLQDNGTFLRVNGLDAQSCLDCHGVVSAATTPFISGVGGAGTLNNSAMFMTRAIDVEDAANKGFASFDGRLINPVSVFGDGGVQQVGKEMTGRLQKLRQRAINHPGQVIELKAKGVHFGSIVADESGTVDTSHVAGVDDDLVVRPFGRKGEFFSVRGFDQGAMMFHLGMQPVEIVGKDVDGDGDGVVNEVQIGEMSALEIFITTQDTPREMHRHKDARKGFRRFRNIGCADCHRPVMRTKSPVLSYSFPEVAEDPEANIFYAVDLRDEPMHFEENRHGGVNVRMFSDLKRHNMGHDLKESFHGAGEQMNHEFITAKLWGVADTAPYLHDGRALTLNAAILVHGGEAKAARDSYAALTDDEKSQILKFLDTLKNPENPNSDVLE